MTKVGNEVLDLANRYLAGMYEDDYFPDFLVEKIEMAIIEVAEFLEKGQYTDEVIQNKLDEMTVKINKIQEEFWAHDSEIETFAREEIADSVDHLLDQHKIQIDLEDALRNRDW